MNFVSYHGRGVHWASTGHHAAALQDDPALSTIVLPR